MEELNTRTDHKSKCRHCGCITETAFLHDDDGTVWWDCEECGEERGECNPHEEEDTGWVKDKVKKCRYCGVEMEG